MIQKSLVLMKPDAVKRGIVGEILHRFERAGLKIVAMKTVAVDKSFGARHYNHNDAWKVKVGERTINDCKSFGLDVMDCFGSTDPKEIGAMVDQKNAEYLATGPVMALVIEGPQAVAKIRSLVGSTFPDTATPGTIRGDFGADSAFSGTKRKRAAYNMIHASGEVDEAIEEINLWFKPEEILSYKRIHEDLYSY